MSNKELGDNMHTLAFFLISLAFTQVARRLGWSVSKRFLYFVPVPLVVTICLLWGSAIALAIHASIVWLKPHWLVKWIFGYAQGAYASISQLWSHRRIYDPSASSVAPSDDLVNSVGYLCGVFGRT